jgi:7,8-dihydro-6-hydroxymethylpterin-pyrophosphokinase
MSEEFTQKEILIELMRETREQSKLLTTLGANMGDVKEHLAKLNSKVASHEKQLNEHSGFITKATAYATIGATLVTVFINRII